MRILMVGKSAARVARRGSNGTFHAGKARLKRRWSQLRADRYLYLAVAAAMTLAWVIATAEGGPEWPDSRLGSNHQARSGTWQFVSEGGGNTPGPIEARTRQVR